MRCEFEQGFGRAGFDNFRVSNKFVVEELIVLVEKP
jgi:hypothetical protein